MLRMLHFEAARKNTTIKLGPNFSFVKMFFAKQFYDRL